MSSITSTEKNDIIYYNYHHPTAACFTVDELIFLKGLDIIQFQCISLRLNPWML